MFPERNSSLGPASFPVPPPLPPIASSSRPSTSTSASSNKTLKLKQSRPLAATKDQEIPRKQITQAAEARAREEGRASPDVGDMLDVTPLPRPLSMATSSGSGRSRERRRRSRGSGSGGGGSRRTSPSSASRRSKSRTRGGAGDQNGERMPSLRGSVSMVGQVSMRGAVPPIITTLPQSSSLSKKTADEKELPSLPDPSPISEPSFSRPLLNHRSSSSQTATPSHPGSSSLGSVASPSSKLNLSSPLQLGPDEDEDEAWASANEFEEGEEQQSSQRLGDRGGAVSDAEESQSGESSIDLHTPLP